MDGFGETELVDTSLKTTLQEILNLEGQHVIELHAGLVEDTDAHETANQGIAFEETLGVLLVEGKKLTVGEEELLVFDISKSQVPIATFRVKVLKHTGQHDESWTE